MIYIRFKLCYNIKYPALLYYMEGDWNMLIAYQVLSAIVLFAIPVFMFTFLMVEQYRRRKETGSKKYEFCLRMRNNEVYLIGLVYPIKAVLGLLAHVDVSVDIVWGIVWFILALMVYKKYKFGIVPLEAE